MAPGSPSTSKSHRFRRFGIIGGVVFVVAVVIGLMVWLLSGSPTAFGDQPPSQVLTQSLANARRAGSALVLVHVTHGSQKQTLADETNRTSGYQVISAGDEFAQIAVVDNIAYIRGNSSALTKYFDLPAPDAPRLAGRWISIRPSDVGYTEVTGGVTLDSMVQSMVPTGTVHIGARIRVHGVRVISVTAASGSTSATVFVQATGAHLPVAAVQESGTGTNRTTATIQLSRWGKRVVVKAPHGAIPISSFTAPTSTTTSTLPGS
jgi:hypothetical protein